MGKIVIEIDTGQTWRDARGRALAAIEREYFAGLWEEVGSVNGVAKRAGTERNAVRAYLKEHNIGGYTKGAR